MKCCICGKEYDTNNKQVVLEILNPEKPTEIVKLKNMRFIDKRYVALCDYCKKAVMIGSLVHDAVSDGREPDYYLVNKDIIKYEEDSDEEEIHDTQGL